MSQPPTTVVHTAEARTHGRYVVRAPSTVASESAPLLVGFHGYGENAEHHLDELSRIPGATAWLIVSVQALHRFYARKTGTVVGCWMTSQDREQMITDNLRYVDSVVEAVTGHSGAARPLVYSGFSQGVAMAYRAATKGSQRASAVIALAGDVPPELCDDTRLTWPAVLVGRGREDTSYTSTHMDHDLAFLTTTGCHTESVVFEGGHHWHDDFRQAAGRMLESSRRRGPHEVSSS